MIQVTERAKQVLKRTLLANVDMPQGRLRLLSRDTGKLGLGIDVEMPSDELVEYEGSTVLVVERRLATSLKGVILDAEDTADGAELVISGKL